jgi:predicted enzyme related to lactoylglutathione lyase
MRMPSPAAVVFAADVARVAAFYRTVFRMRHLEGDATYVVLERDGFQLTVHGLRGESTASGATREDTYVKLCFPVDSIDYVRREATALGGEVWPAEREWESETRGFRACDGRDPEGNVFQAREPLAG